MLKPLPCLSRRRMLRWTAQALLAAGFWPGARAASAATPGEDFEFLVLNDLHHTADECTTWLTQVVAQLKQLHPSAELALVLGDLTDLGTESSHVAVRETLATWGRRFHVQIGNHDYLTPTDRAAYERVFPNSLNYTFRYRGWQFVGVDTTEGQKYEKTQVQPATMSWLDENLKQLETERPTVLFTHFPLAADVQYTPQNANALLEKFRPFNLRAVFGGHYHALTERRDARGVALTTNRCCARLRGNHDGSKEKGYLLCTTQAGTVRHQFVEFRGS